jgi:hypothetical protein
MEVHVKKGNCAAVKKKGWCFCPKTFFLDHEKKSMRETSHGNPSPGL